MCIRDSGERSVVAHYQLRDAGRPADGWLRETARWAWKVKLLPHLDTELKQRLRELAEVEAIRVFAGNLRDLLLAAPAGARPTLGLDPGLRTGVKVAVVDSTGKLIATATIYPHAPRNQWDESLQTLAELCRHHRVELLSIGTVSYTHLDVYKRQASRRWECIRSKASSAESVNGTFRCALPGSISFLGIIFMATRMA